MPKDRSESIPREEEATVEEQDDHQKKLKRQEEDEETGGGHDSSGSDGDRARSKKKRRRHRSSREHRRRGRRSRSESEDSTSSDSYSETESEESGSESESDSSESEGEARRRRRKEKRRRREREHEKERRRKKKEKERKRREEKEERKSKKKSKKKKKEKETNNKGAVTNSWGKYGIIREIDMWNKRPEFTAWLAEVKKTQGRLLPEIYWSNPNKFAVNLESLPNWEEKQMFKEFMEDHNTATFPSKKYYNLDAYHRHKMGKEMKKGSKKVDSERTVFDDEEQRRIELLRERERHKEEQVEALKRSMQTGMAQAMKEQSRLKEEMMYQYKLGNFEAAAAIQRRLDPDVAM